MKEAPGAMKLAKWLWRPESPVPYCAGVLLVEERGLVFTLSKRPSWMTAEGAPLISVRWVGGTPRSGEAPPECAEREAQEELGVRVRLLDCSSTFLLREGRLCGEASVSEVLRPLILDVYPGDATPYRPGLPTGPALYVLVYLARALGPVAPGDVPGLVFVPPSAPRLPEQSWRLAEAQVRGVTVATRGDVPQDARLIVNRVGPERGILELWHDSFGPAAVRGARTWSKRT